MIAAKRRCCFSKMQGRQTEESCLTTARRFAGRSMGTGAASLTPPTAVPARNATS